MTAVLWPAMPKLNQNALSNVRVAKCCCKAIPVHDRVVVDRNRITGGGVTAGIDFGLTIAALLRGQAEAEAIQLVIEYAPAPPFNAGTPETAARATYERLVASRADPVERAWQRALRVAETFKG